MKYQIIQHDGKPVIVNERGEMRPMKENEVFDVVLRKTTKRSVVANAALHLYLTWISEALKNAGYTVATLLRSHPLSSSWSPKAVKEIIWRNMQLSLTGKESTTSIDSDEISLVQQDVHLYLSDIGIDINFPSHEEMLRRGSTTGYRAA